jgi:hypothetical protein
MKITIDQIFESDLNLSKFSNKRLQIKKIGENQNRMVFHFKSTFRMYECRALNYAFTFSKKMALNKGLKVKWILGNCSSPSGMLIN